MQQGQDIDGEAASDNSGWSASMNAAEIELPLGQSAMMVMDLILGMLEFMPGTELHGHN